MTGRRRAGARAAPGRGRGGAAAGCAPSRIGERNGPSRCAPSIRGPIGSRGTSRERGDELLLGRRDQGRLEGRHAGLEQRLAGAAVARGVGRGEVDAAEAVHLQVDEARDRDAAPRRAVRARRPRSGRRRSRRRRARARRRRPRPRRRASRSALQARARTRRRRPRAARRALGASTPASSETMATFASPSAAASAASSALVGHVGREPTARRARARSFAFVATTSTIRLPYVRPSRTIVTVEIVFSTSFCAVPAFIRVEPAITSGPTTATTAWSARRPSRRPPRRRRRP